MIDVRGISKNYGKKEALKDVSFRIETGEIVGFLGRNGAGKTTLMRILSGFISSSSGDAVIDGCPLSGDLRKLHGRIGYLPEHPPLYPEMRVGDYLEYAARLRDIPAKEVKSSVDKVLSDCRINDVRRQIIGTLSKGYKQRVGIAQAVIHDPAVLILDEPTSGLDPVQITHTRELIKDLEGSRTVLISTHILPEIESLVKRVLIIRSGMLVVDENLNRLTDPASGGPRRISLRLKADSGAIQQLFANHPDFQKVFVKSTGETINVELQVLRPQENYNPLLRQLLALPAQVLELREHTLTLEDIFLKLHE